MSADETLPAENRWPPPPVNSAADTMPPPPLSGDAQTMAGAPMNPVTQPRASGLGELRRGDELGRYVVLGRLGAGGMGVVYSAYDPELDRKLAIKLLHNRAGDALDSAGQARLVAEARAMAKLAHPNVITVFDAVTHAERVAVVMEFIDGVSMGEWLEEGPHPVSEVLEVFVKAARGLAAAHDAGIVHRDFKPDNVMMGKDGRVRVMDFGLAHAEGRPPAADTADLTLSDSRRSNPDVRLTVTGAIMGTPAYMAPEQFEGEEADARADQFSFCVSLWEALYGERPFAGATLAELTYAVLKNKRRAPPPEIRGIPQKVHRALDRGLSIARDERWPSMAALIEELQPEAPRRVAGWVVGGLSALGLAGALAFQSQTPPAAPEPCRGVGGEAEAIWNAETRAKVRRAFEASSLAYASNSVEPTVAALDAFASEWATRRRAGCEATMVQKAMTENLYERQTACLEGRLRHMRAIVGVLGVADDDTVERASQLIGTLPELGPCAEADFLMAEIQPPDDPQLRARVEGARDELARLRALEVAGHYDEAMADLEALRQQGKAIDYDPLSAEVAVRVGSLLDYQGKYDEAEVVLEEGYFAAQRAGAGRPAAELAAKLTHVVGDHLRRYDEALRWGRHGEAAVDHFGLDDRIRARVINNSGNIVFRQERYEDALAIFERSRVLRVNSVGAMDRDTAISIANLARTYSKLGRHELAIEMHREGIEIRKATLGDAHPYLADAYQDLATTLESAGRHAEALASQDEALARCVKALDGMHPQCAWSRVVLAELLAKDDPQQVRIGELVEPAIPILQKAHGEAHERVGRALRLVGGDDDDAKGGARHR